MQRTNDYRNKTFPFRKIIIWGAGGTIGRAIVDALQRDRNFDITLLSRQDSCVEYAQGLDVVKLPNDASHAQRIKVLQGQDVVVSCVGGYAGLRSQCELAEAAADAGVKRFIPSEWAFDNGDPLLASRFRSKVETAAFLSELITRHEDFSFTAIASGVFADLALSDPNCWYSINPIEHTAECWDGGEWKCSMSTVPYTAQALVAILKHPARFENQRVYLEPIEASQRDLIRELEKQQGAEYNINNRSMLEVKEEIAEAVKTYAAGYCPKARMTLIGEVMFTSKFQTNFVKSRKTPVLEQEIEMPKLTLAGVVEEYMRDCVVSLSPSRSSSLWSATSDDQTQE